MAAGRVCRFCDPGHVERTGRRVLLQNDLVFAFPDLNPRAKVHLLVASKRHVEGIELLRSCPEDAGLVREMLRVGGKLLSDAGIPAADQHFSFHTRFVRSIHHLHIHALGLPYSSPLQALRYTPWTRLCVDPHDLIVRLDDTRRK